MNGRQVAPDVGGIVNAIAVVVVVLVAGWLLLAWAIVKRPVLALPAALCGAGGARGHARRAGAGDLSDGRAVDLAPGAPAVV